MKQLFIFFFLLVPFLGNSQDILGNKYPGFIVKNDGEKVDGFVKRLSLISSQKRVVFYTDKDDNDTKIVYKPNELMGYRIGSETYLSIAYGDIRKNIKHFLLRDNEGKIEAYVYYKLVTEDGPELVLKDNGTTTTSIEFDGKTKLSGEIVWLKDREKVLALSSPKLVLKFKKIMSDYISDYPELAKKVANKEKGYRLLNIQKILKEYNDYFAKK